MSLISQINNVQILAVWFSALLWPFCLYHIAIILFGFFCLLLKLYFHVNKCPIWLQFIDQEIPYLLSCW